MRNADRGHYCRKWEIPHAGTGQPKFQNLKILKFTYSYTTVQRNLGENWSQKSEEGWFSEKRGLTCDFIEKMRWFRENRCFDGGTFMNFAVFTKCLHEFRCFHEVSSWIWAIWPRCLLFQKTETSQLPKINLLGSDEGKWDSWNFEIAYTRNGLSDEFDGSYLIISNIWWTRSYEVGRLRCSWLRIKKIQVYTLGEHESLENEGTSIFWMLIKIETYRWFWWIWPI